MSKWGDWIVEQMRQVDNVTAQRDRLNDSWVNSRFAQLLQAITAYEYKTAALRTENDLLRETNATYKAMIDEFLGVEADDENQ